MGWGIVEDGGIVDLSDDPSLPYADASQALRSETVLDLAMSACGRTPQHRVQDVTLLSPLPSPRLVLVVEGDRIVRLCDVEILDPGSLLAAGDGCWPR